MGLALGSHIIQAGAPPVVTVSGETISHTVSQPSDAVAGIRWNADGTVDKKVGGTFSQIDASTDWIIPNGAGDSSYEVRHTFTSGASFTTEASAVNVWIALGSDRLYELLEGGESTQTRVCVFEIRKDGGAVIDSATYTFTADNLP